MPDDYQMLVSKVEEIEREAPRTDVNFVDLSELVEKKVEKKVPSYRELMDFIDKIERRQPFLFGKEEEAVVIAPPQAQAEQQVSVQAQPVKAAPEQMQRPVKQPVVREEFKKQEVPPMQVGEPAKMKQVLAAKKEIGALANVLGAIPKFTLSFKRINTKELVLPNLSIADQIAELERIIEGLKESAFDKDHLEVVVQEVYGVQQSVKEMKDDMRRRRKTLTSLDQALWNLRDERIKEAVALIKQ